MKKLLRLICIWSLCIQMVGTVFQSVKAEETTILYEGTCGEGLTWQVNSDKELIISGTGKMQDYGYAHDEIPWRAYRDSITKLVIQDGVKSIGSHAFYDMYFTDCIIADSVVSYGDYCFWHALFLQSFTLSKNVEYLGTHPFYQCGLESINVDPENQFFTSADGVLFNKDMTELLQYPVGKQDDSYTVPDTISVIRSESFRENYYLKNCVIPEGVTKVEDYGFFDCKALEELHLPSSLVSIGRTNFGDSTKLSKVYYAGTEEEWSRIQIGEENQPLLSARLYCSDSETGEGQCGDNIAWDYYDGLLTLIGSGEMYDYNEENVPWFSWSDQIELLQLDPAITHIGSYAFHSLKQVEKVVLPESLVSIGENAFQGSELLSVITIPKTVTGISASVFDHCNSLKDIYYYGTAEQFDGIAIASGNEPLYSAVLHTGFLSGNCGKNAIWILDNSTLNILGNGTMDMRYYSKNEISSNTLLPKEAVIQGDSGYDYWGFHAAQIETVIINKGITSIAHGSFLNHVNLTDVVLPSTLRSIEREAFHGCSSLSELHIPENVATIQEEAFYQCSSLNSFIVDEKNVSFASDDGILYNKQMDTMMIYPPGKNVSEFIIPDHVTSVARYCFLSANQLNKLDLNKVKNFPVWAVVECDALKEVVMSDVTSFFSAAAFIHCYNIESFSTHEGDTVFQTVDGVLYKGNAIMAYPPAKQGDVFVIPDSVTKIGIMCFEDARYLRGIVIPSSVVSISYETDETTSGVTEVCYNGSEEEWNQITFDQEKSFRNAETHYNTLEPSTWSLADDFASATLILKCSESSTEYPLETSDVKLIDFTDSTCTYLATVQYDGKVFEHPFTIEQENTVSEPEWNWAEDYSSATLKFYLNNDPEMFVTINAEVTKTETTPTCETDGEVLYKATAVFHGETYTDQKRVTIEALGHDYAEATYEWIKTPEGYEVSAETICTRDATHVISETVTASETVIKEVSCEEDGEVLYTAVFENEHFKEQTKTVTLEAIGHSYQLDRFVWSEDYSSAEAEFICEHDPAHKKSVEATVTAVRKEPTTLEEGSITYTATVELEGKTYTDEKVVILEKLVPDVHIELTLTNNSASGVVLEWTPVEGAKKYEVFRKEAEWENYYAIRETIYPTYADDDAEVGVTYDYKVRAFVDGVWSDFSASKRITFHPFTDASTSLGNTTYKAILWAYEKGIVKGTSETEYDPQAYCTRAQLCVMLWRMSGKPSVNENDNPFSDVSKTLGNTTYKAILWAYQKGIVKGNADGTFDPYGNTSRANMAVMLWRMAGKPAISATNSPFEDVTRALGNTTFKSILWAYEINLTKGTDKTHYSPNDPCTRAQLAVFLYRLNNRYHFIG